MFKDLLTQPNTHLPFAVGTGLTCLDAVEDTNGGPHRLFMGGSCTNVLLILQTLGWQAAPIGQIGSDRAGDAVIEDIRRWPMTLDFLFQRDEVSTPIFVERVTPGGHSFSRECRSCGKTFSHFTPLTVSEMQGVIEQLPEQIDVCHVERVCESSLFLMQECKRRDALIHFDPNRTGDKAIFEECLQKADVLKYSHEKLPQLSESTLPKNITLQIETCGVTGLRYRFNPSGLKKDNWRNLPAAPCENFKDAAGSGDWLSATIVDSIGRGGTEHLHSLAQDEIEAILNRAMACSAQNCSYEGARGSLYTSVPILTGDDFCPYCGKS